MLSVSIFNIARYLTDSLRGPVLAHYNKADRPSCELSAFRTEFPTAFRTRVTKNDKIFETCQKKSPIFRDFLSNISQYLWPIFPKISQYFGRYFPIFFDILAVVVLYFERATKLKYGKLNYSFWFTKPSYSLQKVVSN